MIDANDENDEGAGVIEVSAVGAERIVPKAER